MTTNQTIDGVPRERIERALDAIEQVGYQDKFIDYTFVRAVKQELRALLDAPIRTPLLGGGALEEQPEWAQVQILKNTIADLQGDIEKLQADLAAQPQGEPSHWADESGNTITAELKAYNLKLGGAPSAASMHYARPLYAEQPAPVAVVLPERRQIPSLFGRKERGHEEDEGFNECIDEVARLNASIAKPD